MRTLLLCLSFFVLFLHSLPSQGHEPPKELSKVERLYYTCKIWGFLKYYHPKVAGGTYRNWDERLLKILANTNHITTTEAFSDYIDRYLYTFGAVNRCTSCQDSNGKDAFLENFDLSWTQSNVFSPELKKRFKDIEANRFQGNHYFIDQGKTGQFVPKNEDPLDQLIWKEELPRLVPLFRYWNYIEYFYPYKYLTEQSWDEALMKLIPTFLSAKTKLDFHLAMLEMVVKIDDANAGFTTPLIDQMPQFTYLPVRLAVLENQVVVTEILDAAKAESDNLELGDEIETINNEAALRVHNRNLRYIWGSSKASKDRSISYTLFMGMEGPVNVTIKRNGRSLNQSINLYRYIDLELEKNTSTPTWSVYPDSIYVTQYKVDSTGLDSIAFDTVQYLDIGYVDLGRLNRGEVDEMMTELMATDALIFDIRNAPKGTYRALANYLNPRDTTFAIYTKPDLSYPGKFTWAGEGRVGKMNDDSFTGPVALLVNEKTQGHAEFTCMSLQTAPNAITVGSPTAGADGALSRFTLMKRYQTVFTGTGVYYPDRSNKQREGIIPEVLVTPTLDAIRGSRDEVLEKAIAVIKERMDQ